MDHKKQQIKLKRGELEMKNITPNAKIELKHNKLN